MDHRAAENQQNRVLKISSRNVYVYDGVTGRPILLVVPHLIPLQNGFLIQTHTNYRAPQSPQLNIITFN